MRRKRFPGAGHAVDDVPGGIHQARTHACRPVGVERPVHALALDRAGDTHPVDPVGHQARDVVTHRKETTSGEAGRAVDRLDARDLVRAQELGVLEDRTPVALALAANDVLQRQQELFIGFVADGVGSDLPVAVPVLVEKGDELVLRIDPHAAVVDGSDTGRIRCERPRHEHGVDAAVEPELDSGEADTIDVTLVQIGARSEHCSAGVDVGRGAALVDLISRGNDPVGRGRLGEQHQVDRHQLFVDNRLHDRNVVAAQAEPHLASGGDAILRPQPHRPADTFSHLRRGQGRACRQHAHPCRLGCMAGELTRAGLARKETALRIGRSGSELHLPDQGTVHDALVAGPVGDADRTGCADGIEFGSGRMALLSHLLRAIAHSHDPITLGNFGRMRLQTRKQFGDVLDAGEVGIEHRMRCVHQVAVRIDEPGHQGRASEVDPGRIRAGSPLYLHQRSDCRDTAVPHQQRLGIARRVANHREDVAAGVVETAGRGGRTRGIRGRRSVRGTSGQRSQAEETDCCGPASKGEGDGHRMNSRKFPSA